MSKDIDPSAVRRRLDYNPDTGLFTWRTRAVDDGPRARSFNSRWAGKPAITAVHPKGYRCGNFSGKVILAHRLAWAHVYGEWPEMQIDHINQVKHDNRIANLRSVSNAENHRNMPLRSDNTSGYNGVIFDSRAGKWVARLGKVHIGYYHDILDAAKAIDDAKESFGYAATHGGHG